MGLSLAARQKWMGLALGRRVREIGKTLAGGRSEKAALDLRHHPDRAGEDARAGRVAEGCVDAARLDDARGDCAAKAQAGGRAACMRLHLRPAVCAVGFACCLAYVALFPAFSLFCSTGLYTRPLLLAAAALVGFLLGVCADAASLRLRAQANGRASVALRAALCAAAVLSCAAGLAFVTGITASGRGASACVSIAAAVPLMTAWVRRLAQGDAPRKSWLSVVSLACVALVCVIGLLLTVCLGTLRNHGFYSQMMLVVVSALPVFSAASYVVEAKLRGLGTGGASAGCEAGGLGVAGTCDASSSVGADVGVAEGVSASAADAHAGVAEQRFAFVLSAAALAVFFLGGFCFNPFQMNMMGLFSGMAALLAAAGVALAAVRFVLSRTKRRIAAGAYKVMLACGLLVSLAGMAMLVFLGENVIASVLIISAQVLFLALMWTFDAPKPCAPAEAGDASSAGSPVAASWPKAFRRSFAEASKVLMVVACVVAYSLGILLKQHVGYDSLTVAGVVLASTLLLISVLLLGLFAMRDAPVAVANGAVLASGAAVPESAVAFGAAAASAAVLPSELAGSSAGQPILAPQLESALSVVEEARRAYLEGFGLTARETDIALKFADGLTMERTANELGISINTVRYHMKSLYAKTECASKAELQKKIQDATS